MPEPLRESSDSLLHEPLAIAGGPAAVPAGPPDWPLEDECVRDQLLAAWQDGSWGRYHAQFSEQLVSKLRDLHGVEHVLPCSSGTVAVELALRGLKVKPGDEVVLAAYDFPGNFRAIEAVGATPVLVDIDPRSWCLDAERISAARSPATRAVIVSHLHGGLADMQQLTELAHQFDLGVVEDACQASGATVQGRPAGTWGDVGVLSFGGSKLLTAGRGGAILTADASIYQRAKIYGERGNDAFPLSELQAAVLLPQLDLLPQRNQLRRKNVDELVEAWLDLDLLEPVLAHQQPGLPSYFKVALRYDPQAACGRTREQFIDTMIAEGVAVGPGFRGFVRRGGRRCRSSGELTSAANAAATTIVMHHPALLQPVHEIARIVRAYQKVACHFSKSESTR